ncbi:MAG: NAD(P)-dependent alcohol dehydrogenase [Candidatus Melainabacteria bacterium]|nr:MAG: NAD(P)-dependent alcohol dehydrogenase [Candidatus Melainabacteria bacterium]
MAQAVKLAQNVQAYRLVEKFGIDHLVVSESKPEPIGHGQVRVKMHAASLNYRDLMIVRGEYNPNLRQPTGLVPLSDGAGEVVELGEGVTRFKVGDRVAGLFFQSWLAGECDEQKSKSALAGSIDGVLTTYKVFHEDGLISLPAHLSYEEGATLPCAAVTAWNALIFSGGLRAGETVLTQGTGGVSIFALQFSKITGARVIVISSSDEKLARAEKLGANDLINYKKNPNWEIKVKELTRGRGVDHIVELGGASTLTKSLQAIRLGGQISLIGVLSGKSGEINPVPILMKNVCVQGIYVGSREMFEGMNAAISLHKLHPVIDRVFPFAEAKQAFSYMESSSHLGKIVIKIA